MRRFPNAERMGAPLEPSIQMSETFGFAVAVVEGDNDFGAEVGDTVGDEVCDSAGGAASNAGGAEMILSQLELTTSSAPESLPLSALELVTLSALRSATVSAIKSETLAALNITASVCAAVCDCKRRSR